MGGTFSRTLLTVCYLSEGLSDLMGGVGYWANGVAEKSFYISMTTIRIKNTLHRT